MWLSITPSAAGHWCGYHAECRRWRQLTGVAITPSATGGDSSLVWLSRGPGLPRLMTFKLQVTLKLATSILPMTAPLTCQQLDAVMAMSSLLLLTLVSPARQTVTSLNTDSYQMVCQVKLSMHAGQI